ncbi:alpha/beta hydrolase [Sphingomonas alpina]|uniref:Alpha/beta hydrolase n=1 Tax=Sphingomonas alpina TaxID=653931 RepID=A0A7H0LDT0_9SPHN|nr:alpha/beta hydrolase [Sphingomonas alpina]QNQ07833.1 alpha/beta hydrolase [Sphingomonas alpina]
MRIGGITLWLLGSALALYLAALGAFYIFQRVFYYPAPGGGLTLAEDPGPGFQDMSLTTSDGLVLRAFYHPPRQGRPTLVFFHGNGGDLNGSEVATRAFAAQGYGVLLPEYRGYGGNPGTPNEQDLYRDGAAGIYWLENSRLPLKDIVLIGNSLGSGVATELAKRKKVGGLILVSGFASLPRVVAQHYPYIPGFLVRDKFDNRAKIGRVTAPILIYHGTADTVVPVSNGRALARAQPAATFALERGAGHDLMFSPVATRRISAWLRDRFPVPPPPPPPSPLPPPDSGTPLDHRDGSVSNSSP